MPSDPLREELHRYRHLIEQSAEGVWRTWLREPLALDLPEEKQIEHMLGNSYVAECNDAMARMYGYTSSSELLGKSVQGLLPANPHNMECLRKYIRAGFRLDETESHEIDRTGNPKWFINNKIGVIENGFLLGTWEIQRDITELRKAEIDLLKSQEELGERKQREQTIREAEARYRTLVEQIPAVVYVDKVDVPGKTVYVSPQIYELLGVSQAEWLTDEDYRLWTEMIHPEDRDRTVKAILQCTEKKQGYDLQYRMIGRNGQVIWFRDRGAILQHGSEPAVFHGVMFDITAQKNAEEERVRLETRILEGQKLEAIGRLAGGVAHDFNNTLMAISAYCELLLLKLPVMDTKRSDVEKIREAADGSATLVRRLLAYGRRQMLQPQELDLNDLLKTLEPMLRSLLRENVELCLMGSRVSQIRFDRAEMEGIILNLVMNARDAMPAGGRLVIETANAEIDEFYCASHPDVNPGQYILVSFSDTGTGMDAATLSHMFEPFYTTKDRNESVGLGLASVYGTIRQIGGYILAYSEPGRGTTLKLYFPCPEQREEPESAVTLEGKETILLVDDDHEIRNCINNRLENFGYRVLPASSPTEALEILHRHSGTIDVLLTDLIMPQMNGMELSKEATLIHSDLKTIFMSGYSPEVSKAQTSLDPRSHFLSKPFPIKKLLITIRSALGEVPVSPTLR